MAIKLKLSMLVLMIAGVFSVNAAEPTVLAPDQLSWSVDQKTGLARADLLGGRDKPGLFVQRMKMPAGFRAPRHTHDGPLNGTVLSGALHMRFGTESEARIILPGGFLEIPAGLEHEEWTEGPTEIEVRGIGPQKTIPVVAKP